MSISRDEPGLPFSGKATDGEKARRIAANVGRLPELLHKTHS